jgi:hypothetical protein
MLKSLLIGAGLAGAIGLAAQAAQPDMSNAAPQGKAQDTAAQSDAGAAMAAKPGMMVRDANGEEIGSIVQVGQTAEGVSAVVVKVDGQPFTLAASTLTPAKGGFVSSMTKAQIKAAPKGGG